jgi:hypothetical protein
VKGGPRWWNMGRESESWLGLKLEVMSRRLREQVDHRLEEVVQNCLRSLGT